jgi:hypothetical protein
VKLDTSNREAADAVVEADGEIDRNDIRLMTGRGEAGDHVYWVQAIMVEDPTWQWTGVIGGSRSIRVAVPTLFIVPALTLAVYLTTRCVLPPLTRVARQASALSGAVASGRPLEMG